MILRRPYAFFIKIFKPCHILMAFIVAFLIYKTNQIYVFFNQYIYSGENVVGQTIKKNLFTNELIVIPIIIVIFSLIFLGIMFSKKKPIKFYIINILVFLAILIITQYTSNFLVQMEKIIVSVKLVKLYRDLVLINMAIEGLSFIFLIIRGLGINFRKFNFDSDITKLNISDFDKEEFEFNVNIDIESAKRNRKKKMRYIKYIYQENKIIVKTVLFSLFIIGLIIFVGIMVTREKKKVEGVIYNIDNFNLVANKTMLLKENFKGKVLTDDNLIVVDISLKSDFPSVSLFIKDFRLQIDEVTFLPQTKYNHELLDLGNAYQNNLLSANYVNYLLIFEIPDKFLESDMFLVYNNTKINLSPQTITSEKSLNTKVIGEEISFEKSLGQISFKVNSFEINNYFLIKYNYCVGNDCILSKEYIKPSINENFDKVVLKANVDFLNNSKLGVKNFYEFFSIFGVIHYKKGDTWFAQINNFEQLKSKKIDNKNNIYIGINSEILSAESIKLVFDIREVRYEYILK